MSATETPVLKYVVGHYGDLRQKPNPDGLVFHFVPSLRDELGLARNAKGTDLTPAEQTAVVQRATVMLLPPSKAEAIAQERGFRDTDPENLLSANADECI